MSLVIVGAGAFGSALACALSPGEPVLLLGRDQGQMDKANQTRQAEKLPGLSFESNVTATADPSVLDQTDCALLCIPTQQLTPFLNQNAQRLAGKSVVACCKGIDISTQMGPVETMAAIIPDAKPAILTGPSFAADIAIGLPTALTLAAEDEGLCETLQNRLKRPALRIYRSNDVVGAQLGGALKNVVAIAAGACVGAKLGDSARAAIISRGFAEMQKCAAQFGAKSETLMGLSGLGDLVLTCTSHQSRNFAFGVSLGENRAFDPNITVEGASTAKAVDMLATQNDLDLPVCRAVKDLVTGQITVDIAMEQLLARRAGTE